MRKRKGGKKGDYWGAGSAKSHDRYSKMSRGQLEDEITTQQHYQIQDEGGTEGDFREGLAKKSKEQLVRMARQ